jgi:hypothetical protein
VFLDARPAHPDDTTTRHFPARHACSSHDTWPAAGSRGFMTGPAAGTPCWPTSPTSPLGCQPAATGRDGTAACRKRPYAKRASSREAAA